jgi:uncharacterized membrane protein
MNKTTWMLLWSVIEESNWDIDLNNNCDFTAYYMYHNYEIFDDVLYQPLGSIFLIPIIALITRSIMNYKTWLENHNVLSDIIVLIYYFISYYYYYTGNNKFLCFQPSILFILSINSVCLISIFLVIGFVGHINNYYNYIMASAKKLFYTFFEFSSSLILFNIVAIIGPNDRKFINLENKIYNDNIMFKFVREHYNILLIIAGAFMIILLVIQTLRSPFLNALIMMFGILGFFVIITGLTCERDFHLGHSPCNDNHDILITGAFAAVLIAWFYYIVKIKNQQNNQQNNQENIDYALIDERLENDLENDLV